MHKHRVAAPIFNPCKLMLNCKLKHLIQLRFFVIIVMENNNFRVEILSLRHYFGQLALDI